MPHSNMIQPHFSREAADRPKSFPAWVSVSSTNENSSISSRPKRTLDFSKGMAVIAHVPMSVQRGRKTTISKNDIQHADLHFIAKHFPLKSVNEIKLKQSKDSNLWSPGLGAGCECGEY